VTSLLSGTIFFIIDIAVGGEFILLLKHLILVILNVEVNVASGSHSSSAVLVVLSL
jgi:hypothetical protein